MDTRALTVSVSNIKNIFERAWILGRGKVWEITRSFNWQGNVFEYGFLWPHQVSMKHMWRLNFSTTQKDKVYRPCTMKKERRSPWQNTIPLPESISQASVRQLPDVTLHKAAAWTLLILVLHFGNTRLSDLKRLWNIRNNETYDSGFIDIIINQAITFLRPTITFRNIWPWWMFKVREENIQS